MIIRNIKIKGLLIEVPSFKKGNIEKEDKAWGKIKIKNEFLSYLCFDNLARTMAQNVPNKKVILTGTIKGENLELICTDIVFK